MPAAHPPLRILLVVLTLALVGSTGLLGAPQAHAAADPKLVREVNAVLSDSRVQKARVGVVIRDARTGEYLYRKSSTSQLTAASNMKLITAGAAMSELGPGYRFHTDVLAAAPNASGTIKGDLWLKGYGDPTLLESDFRALAQTLRGKGVRTVTGRLVADATWLDNQRYSPYWSSSYASEYYASQISALTVAPNTDYDAGTVIVKYAPASKVGARPTLTVYPAAARKYVRIVNKATTKSSGSTTISARRTNGTNTITVSGSIARGRAASRTWVSVHDPKLLAATVFRAELTRAGITVRGATTAGRTPSGKRVLAKDTSMPLSQLLVPFLKLSNNNHAEVLTKTMGRVKSGQGTWSAGLARTRAWLRSQGVDTATVRLVDGSGLARANRLTATALGTVLVKVRAASWFSSYHKALPIAGVNSHMTGGTLRSRMRGTPAAGNAHAKTGTLTGVTALSGYVTDASGRSYVFVMISNYTGASPRPVEDKLVVALARHRR